MIVVDLYTVEIETTNPDALAMIRAALRTAPVAMDSAGETHETKVTVTKNAVRVWETQL